MTDYILPPVDTRLMSPEGAETMQKFFHAKNSHSAEATMAFFAPDMVTYTDSTLGWRVDGFTTLRDAFAGQMPNWGDGRSYADRLLGGSHSAIVEFTDTAELFGSELHLIGAIDFEDGLITRWVDYWDTSAFPSDTLDSLLGMGSRGTDYATVPSSATGAIVDASGDFQRSIAAGDAAAVEALLTYDAIYEDRATRTALVGRSAIGRFVARSAGIAPWGGSSTLNRVLGEGRGGGYEWIASGDSGVYVGITALELDEQGRISRITVLYDGQLLSSEHRTELALSALEPGAR